MLILLFNDRTFKNSVEDSMGGFGANDDDGSGRSQPSKGMTHEKVVNVKRAHLRSLPFEARYVLIS